ncbi:MAG: ClpX C4-type zinc finger protein [Myxococcota bacterium]
MRQPHAVDKDRPRRLGVRLLILAVVGLGPLAGALTGTEAKRLGVVTVGALLVGVVIEREVDRAMPLGPTRCGFCGRPRDEVHRLVAGYHGVAICEECVTECAELLHPPGERGPARAPGADPWRPPGG